MLTAKMTSFVSSISLAILCVTSLAYGAHELLKNPSFEHGITNWHHDGFSMQAEGLYVHKGVASVKCTGRTRTYHGPGQDIDIKRGGRYNFNSYIRLINENPNKMYQLARVKIAFHLPDGKTIYFPVARRPYLTQSEGWVAIGGDFVAPDVAWTSARLYVEGLDPHVDYYYDDATLTEIPTIDWETEANNRIENLRKSNIHFVLNVDSHFKTSDLMVQIDHKKHSFGFGSMVRADYMVDSNFKTYQNIVGYMFNWATIQDYKWKYDRGTPAHPDFTVAVKATDELIRRGLKVRGHCMFWAVDKNVPDYVRAMDGPGVKKAVEEHIKYMTGISKGKLDHWDVNNELVHGHFFEERTQDPKYTQHMFQQIHTEDPKPILFLNEYSVVANGDATQAYLTQIKQFKAAHVGLGMVGVQSHLNGNPDLTVLKRRLDVLAQPGLPIWITELDIANGDDKVKADWYESVLRLYFSHPSIKGITFWGFWDHDIDPQKALVHGYGYTNHDWHRDGEKMYMSNGQPTLVQAIARCCKLKGLTCEYRTAGPSPTGVNDRVVTPCLHNSLALGCSTWTWASESDGSYFNHTSCTSQNDDSKTGVYSYAACCSGGHVQCQTQVSSPSGQEVGDTAQATCPSGSVMTGCNVYSLNGRAAGAFIAKAHGVETCLAFNGFKKYGQEEGVRAMASCCHV